MAASRLRAALAARFGVDARALAAFRIAVAALVFADLCLRARSLRAFYTDAGVLPRAALRDAYPVFSQLSIHALSGALWVQVGLFCLAGVAALALLVGYRTRLALLLSWLLLVSLHARNPLVLNGGDVLLRRVTFWALFLPLGARWAVDATDAPDRVAGPATAALLGQVVVVYVVNAVLKLRGDRWLAGEAIRYVFSLDQFATPLGATLTAAPPLLRAATWGWLVLVCLSPLLLLATGRARAALASLFVAAHLGMLATMRLGLFPLVSVAALLPFFPPFVWDAVERRAATLRRALPDVESPRPLFSTPPAVERWRRTVGPAVVAVLVVLVLVWDAPGLSAAVVGGTGAPDPASDRWDMFAPEPLTVDGWYVVPATTASGARVDAFRGGAVSWDRPPNLGATYPTQRWRKYLANVWRGNGDSADFGRYLCGRWNRSHADGLVSLRVVYVAEPTVLGAPDPTVRETLGRYRC